MSIESNINNQLASPGQLVIPLTKIIEKIRKQTRDIKYLNRLIDGEESSDEDILLALQMCFSQINQTPPLINRYTFQNPPPLHLLIKGTICFLLDSVSMIHIRNGLQFNDGNLNVNTDKSQNWIQFAQIMKSEYMKELIDWKRSVNIEDAMGLSVSSEYIILSGSPYLYSN